MTEAAIEGLFVPLIDMYHELGVSFLAAYLRYSGADLDDIGSVVRALYAAGFVAAEFGPVLDEALAVAREPE